VQLFFDNGHQHVNGDCYPNLGLGCIRGGSIKCFDPKVLLDPFEEEFDLPATPKQFGDIRLAPELPRYLLCCLNGIVNITFSSRCLLDGGVNVRREKTDESDTDIVNLFDHEGGIGVPRERYKKRLKSVTP